MKKIVGIPLLLLANMIILAHAVVPHHHHDGMAVSICDVLSVNETLEHNHDHSHPHTHHHGHDGELDEDCLLNDLYLRINQDRQQRPSDKTDLFNDWSDIPLLSVISNLRIEINDYGNLPFRRKPHLFFSYNHYVTHSLGLRAPPCC